MAVGLPIALLLIVGCSGRIGLTSEEGEESGVLYHLPKTILNVTVRRYHDTESGRVWFSLGGPGTLTSAGAEGSKTFNHVNERDIVSETVPDPAHRYIVQYQPSALSDDRLCISRKPNGLLYDVQFAADDRTPQVIFNIARFIGGFIGSPASVSFQERTLVDAPKIVVREHTDQVDPFDEADIAEFDRALQHVFDGEPLRVDYSRMRAMLAKSTATWPKGCSMKDGCSSGAWAQRCDREHICYRTKVRIPVDLILDDEAVDVQYAEVVNAWDIGTISVSRAFLVQKITKLRFEDGALLSAIIRKPSEVEEASLIPLNVVNAMLSVPSGLWQSAFSDEQFNNQVLTEINQYQSAVADLNDAVKSAKLEGAKPIGTGNENYNLNCGVASRGSGFLNILSTSQGNFAQ